MVSRCVPRLAQSRGQGAQGRRIVNGRMSTLEAALDYHRRGWRVVPISNGFKKPVIDGWPNLTFSAADMHRHFRDDQNIGIRLGAASGCLVDIDLDCPEALAIADLYLPVTEAKFGRQSKPLSHRLYCARRHQGMFCRPARRRNAARAAC